MGYIIKSASLPDKCYVEIGYGVDKE
jgi:hypothetical protein